MNEEQRAAVIEGLNDAARRLEHMAFETRDGRLIVEKLRENILNGIKLIYEQENIIRALMGDFGDACDVDGCGRE